LASKSLGRKAEGIGEGGCRAGGSPASRLLLLVVGSPLAGDRAMITNRHGDKRRPYIAIQPNYDWEP
jgi:hypothetical protein